MSDLDDLQFAVGTWATTTFPRATPTSIVAHLKRECDELARAIAQDERSPAAVAEEAADCLLLLLHLADTLDFSLLDATEDKQHTNEDRTWGTPDREGVVEHVREVTP